MNGKTGILSEIFGCQKPIIGMVHLRPLPGSPLYDRRVLDFQKITELALSDATKLRTAGVDGIQVENIWDYPYLKGDNVGHETTAAMAVIAAKVKESTGLPLGINCHLNAGIQALAIAVAAGANWIRVFEWVNAYVSHSGIVEGIGPRLARYRKFLQHEDIKFFCDVNVKHGSHFIISDRTINEQARDAESEGADALIVTGFETGKPPSTDRVKEFSQGISLPVLVGSGITLDNVTDLLSGADGAIVGSYFKYNSDWKDEVDQDVAAKFMKIVKKIRTES